MSASPAPRSGLSAILGNACYLGTSWTWVIGMLFPALALRDYGLWGFVAFAVPNVVGAAAMGFILTPEKAKAILEKHKTACGWFSVATLAFHLFVAAWLLPALLGTLSVGIVVLAVATCLIARQMAGNKGIWIASAAVWCLSMAMFAKGMGTEGAWSSAHWELGRLGKNSLFAFIPASVLGFALCPYLDLTFLKARAQTERHTGRWAFLLGFGIVFCAMIFFTVCYGGQLEAYFHGAPLPPLEGPWRALLMAHLPVQIGLTLAWHSTEFQAHAPRKLGLPLAACCFAAVALGLFLGRTADAAHSEHEIAYRSFLLLYGTVLPAYVLLKMIPAHRPAPERVRTGAFVCASLLVYPLAFGTFVLDHAWLILPSIGIFGTAFAATWYWPGASEPAAAAHRP